MTAPRRTGQVLAPAAEPDAETVRVHALLDEGPDPAVARMLAYRSREFRYSHDGDGVFTHVSPSVEAITGYTPAEWRVHYTRYLSDNPINAAARELTEIALRTGDAQPPYRIAVRHRDGHEILLEIAEHPYFDGNGVAGITGLARDVTGEEALLDECQRALRRYRTLFETSRDGIFVADAETGILLDVNPAGESLAGRCRAELIGQHFTSLHPTHATAQCTAAFQAAARSRDALTEIPLTVVRPDGREIPVEIATSTFEHEGRLVIQGVFRDVSAQAARTAALREAVQQMNRALASAPSGLCLADRDGRITQPNFALSVLSGRTPDQLADQLVWSLLETADPASARRQLQRVLTGRRRSAAIRGRLTGSGRQVLLHAGGLEVATGGAILLWQDLSEIESAQAEVAEQRQRTTRALAEMAVALARTIEQRDPYTAGHQSRVARIAVAIGRELGLSEEQLVGVDMGAQLHDIGKIGIPAELLTFPGRLSGLQLALIREHPTLGHAIVKDIATPWPIAEIILQHHERLDGSGYPAGLRGDAICLEARIVAVADVLEAITAHRPYRPALGLDVGLDELRRGRGTLYEASIVDACLALTRDPIEAERLIGAH
jgi:PAS domain S-box-containing protein